MLEQSWDGSLDQTQKQGVHGIKSNRKIFRRRARASKKFANPVLPDAATKGDKKGIEWNACTVGRRVSKGTPSNGVRVKHTKP